jgi:hypothetical protein
MTKTNDQLLELAKQGMVGYFESIITMSESKSEVKNHFLDVNERLRDLIRELDDQLIIDTDKSKSKLLEVIQSTQGEIEVTKAKPKKRTTKKVNESKEDDTDGIEMKQYDEEVIDLNTTVIDDSNDEKEGI